MILSVISTFESRRNEDSFFKVWEKIKEFAQLNQITLECFVKTDNIKCVKKLIINFNS